MYINLIVCELHGRYLFDVFGWRRGRVLFIRFPANCRVHLSEEHQSIELWVVSVHRVESMRIIRPQGHFVCKTRWFLVFGIYGARSDSESVIITLQYLKVSVLFSSVLVVATGAANTDNSHHITTASSTYTILVVATRAANTDYSHHITTASSTYTFSGVIVG